ncbi:hypothetical protein QVD17_39669 [Tagetes erecta]|uniref:Uncharacterized protein n=1 Tax=Tagetes erecta TaxID=13708 RepID=A0AAD8JNY5_TARER|nr:hypothetical protein QVD17_39669 [Tagetes erecta]
MARIRNWYNQSKSATLIWFISLITFYAVFRMASKLSSSSTGHQSIDCSCYFSLFVFEAEIYAISLIFMHLIQKIGSENSIFDAFSLIWMHLVQKIVYSPSKPSSNLYANQLAPSTPTPLLVTITIIDRYIRNHHRSLHHLPETITATNATIELVSGEVRLGKQRVVNGTCGLRKEDIVTKIRRLHSSQLERNGEIYRLMDMKGHRYIDVGSGIDGVRFGDSQAEYKVTGIANRSVPRIVLPEQGFMIAQITQSHYGKGSSSSHRSDASFMGDLHCGLLEGISGRPFPGPPHGGQ